MYFHTHKNTIVSQSAFHSQSQLLHALASPHGVMDCLALKQRNLRKHITLYLRGLSFTLKRMTKWDMHQKCWLQIRTNVSSPYPQHNADVGHLSLSSHVPFTNPLEFRICANDPRACHYITAVISQSCHVFQPGYSGVLLQFCFDACTASNSLGILHGQRRWSTFRAKVI